MGISFSFKAMIKVISEVAIKSALIRQGADSNTAEMLSKTASAVFDGFSYKAKPLSPASKFRKLIYNVIKKSFSNHNINLSKIDIEKAIDEIFNAVSINDIASSDDPVYALATHFMCFENLCAIYELDDLQLVAEEIILNIYKGIKEGIKDDSDLLILDTNIVAHELLNRLPLQKTDAKSINHISDPKTYSPRTRNESLSGDSSLLNLQVIETVSVATPTDDEIAKTASSRISGQQKGKSENLLQSYVYDYSKVNPAILGDIVDLAISPDTELAAISTTTNIVYLMSSSFNIVDEIELPDTIERAVFSSDSMILAILTSNGYIYIFTVNSNFELREKKYFFSGLEKIYFFDLSSDAKYTLVCGYNKDKEMDVITILDTNTGDKLNDYCGISYYKGVKPIAKFVPTKKDLIICSYMGQDDCGYSCTYIMCYFCTTTKNSISGWPCMSMEHSENIRNIEYSNDGTIIAISTDKYLTIINATTYSIIKRLVLHDSWLCSNPSFLSLGGNFVAVVRDDKMLDVFNLKRRKIHTTLIHKYDVHAFILGKDIVITASGGGLFNNPDYVAIHIWDKVNYNLLKTIKVPYWVKNISFSSDNRKFYVLLRNKRLQIFSSTTFELLAEF